MFSCRSCTRFQIFLECKKITTRVNTEVTSIDRKKKRIEFKDVLSGLIGNAEYDKLIIATGSTPRKPQVPGIELEGVTYPYVTIDVSSVSHPYYTGKQKVVGNEGSAARFQQRYGRFIGTKRG